ncbi:MAG: Farnesyl pyrophosphate synthetase [Cirrosporium novae-zelandiae]|nr:MAG: Farnesyl pyrophosphate synthetase [Cirrosporium novae-zelandiae]
MPATLKEFESVFPTLVEDLKSHANSYGLPKNASEWYEKNLNANTIGGKCNRGLSVIDTATIISSKPLDEHTQFLSSTLGWMVELLQAFFLVSDDIMDSSITRRGQPCWYRQSGVGMIAINDAFMLESSIYILLKKHFRSLPCYLPLIELFHECTFQTECGQLCDLITAPEDKVDLSNFSMEKYVFIVHYKTAFYSFYLPVALAMHLMGVATDANLEQARKILIPLGEYFQIQDDYLDNFGSPEVIGKIGTDIQDNKCSWLINQALQKVNPQQMEILERCYGRKDAEKEKEVKKVFEELNLEGAYKVYEENVVGKIRSLISEVDESKGLPKRIFEAYLEKIYKRTK